MPELLPALDRRSFLGTFAAGLLAAPLAAEAQSGRVYRIGVTVASDINYMAFRQGLRDAGWVPGQNPTIERRSVGGERDRVADMVSEIVALKVDVILATAPWTIRSFQKATSTIPIVGLDLGELNQQVVIRDSGGTPVRVSGYVQGHTVVCDIGGAVLFRGRYYDSRVVQSLLGDNALTPTGQRVVDHFENGFGEGPYAGHAFPLGVQLVREGTARLTGQGHGQID